MISSPLRNTVGDERGGNMVSIPCLLDGVIIQNGFEWEAHGGGMYINKGARVRNCIFRNNNNSTGHGGGLFCQGGPTPDNKNEYIIENSLFINNHAYDNGAGVQIAFNGRGIFLNCTFVNNKTTNHTGGAVGGGGIGNSDFIFINTIAYNNFGGNVASSYGIDYNVNGGNIVISLNSAIESTSTRFSDSDDTGHLVLGGTVVPRFKSPSFIIGHTNNESEIDDIFSASYELNAGSPCIDAGANTNVPFGIMLPEKDLAGNTRLLGSRVDIGAYEYNFPSALSSVDSNRIFAHTNDKNVYISGTVAGEFLNVYNAQGVLVERLYVESDLTVLKLKNKGIYVIVSGKETLKVSL